METIRKAAVLGAGVMGSGIAAHLAGAGIPVHLFDIVPKEPTEAEKARGWDLSHPKVRNRFAIAGVETALAARPAAFYDKRDAARITCCNYEDDSALLADCDWIVEVVAESLPIKRKVFANVAKHRKPGSIVTSNTSGISVRDLVSDMPDEMRRRFFVTHFFNPVRYMKLLELVPAAETDRDAMLGFAEWSERALGKGIVYAKDTPNFCANRIGAYGLMATLRAMREMGLSVEAVDKILGPATGRPKSAVFRTLDMVGLDTFEHVAANVYDGCPDDEEREIFRFPEFMKRMIGKGLLGEKVKQGFYKVSRGAGGKEILVIDTETLEYRSQAKIRYPSLGMAKGIDDVSERLRAVVGADDDAGRFAWRVLADTLVYAADRIPEIADDVVNVDRAMRWGYAWDLGPFEAWDAVGVRAVVDRLEKEGRKAPALAAECLRKGEGRFYRSERGARSYFDIGGSHRPVPGSSRHIVIADVKARDRVIDRNDSATLVDIGDGVALLEFHTKMNAIDGDIVAMVNGALDRVEKGMAGLVIGNDAVQAFSAGANIFMIAMAISNKQWDVIGRMVEGFQNANMRMRYAARPVVAAPFGLVLGGGAEVTMHAQAVQAHAELYMGLVEFGVGLIPAGGGSKEMLFRGLETAPAKGPFPPVQYAFEAIGFAKVSTSGAEAREIGFLRPTDGITINRDHLIHDAKDRVLAMARDFKPLQERTISLPGKGGRLALEYAADNFRRSGQITEYECLMARRFARVLTGGDTHPSEEVTERRILELEKECFLSLCGEPKTMERIQAMLTTGKPLRN